MEVCNMLSIPRYCSW